MPERWSVRWTAPEVLAETGTPSTEADVFSFGMVMVEVCCNSSTARPPQVNRFFTYLWRKAFTGMVPFSDHIPPAASMAIISGKRPSRPTHSALTDSLWELMNQCWDQDRRIRPRMLEALLALTSLIHKRTRPSRPPSATANLQTLVSDIQQRLENPNLPNEEYRPLLYALLGRQNLKSYIDSLQNGDLLGFAELLDKASKADRHLHCANIGLLGAQPNPGHG